MADLLQLPGGCSARWVTIPPADLPPKVRPIHIARTIVAGCQTECGVTLKAGWNWMDGADCVGIPRPAVCEECWELINHLTNVWNNRAVAK